MNIKPKFLCQDMLFFICTNFIIVVMRTINEESIIKQLNDCQIETYVIFFNTELGMGSGI